MTKFTFVLVFTLVLGFCTVFGLEYVTVSPKDGDSGETLLKRYKLELSSKNLSSLKELNPKKFDSKGRIFLHHKYKLPIAIHKFNGKTIKSSLSIDDNSKALEIHNYNLDLENDGIKDSYKKNKKLWLPVNDIKIEQVLSEKAQIKSKEKTTEKTIVTKAHKTEKAEVPKTDNDDDEEIPTPTKKKHSMKANDLSLLGAKSSKLTAKSNILKGHYYYLICGHGGPDPGAIGSRDGVELHEHEYAYDVTLRLAKALMERGATVYVIVQDRNDGIREDKLLPNDASQVLINGDTISHVQAIRLKQRTDIVNSLYRSNKSKAHSQTLIEIHVDSRITDQRIDIFFYNKPGSLEGRRLNNILAETIKEKYDANQPGRGYQGSVTERNLFTLRNALPIGAYIELGNIQNPNDQYRLIEPNNRQAIANWLALGLVKAIEKPKIKENNEDE